MKTVKARFTGTEENLKDFLVCGIHFESSKRILKNSLFITWIMETGGIDEVMSNCIDPIQMESLGINMNSLFSTTQS